MIKWEGRHHDNVASDSVIGLWEWCAFIRGDSIASNSPDNVQRSIGNNEALAHGIGVRDIPQLHLDEDFCTLRLQANCPGPACPDCKLV